MNWQEFYEDMPNEELVQAVDPFGYYRQVNEPGNPNYYDKYAKPRAEILSRLESGDTARAQVAQLEAENERLRAIVNNHVIKHKPDCDTQKSIIVTSCRCGLNDLFIELAALADTGGE